MCSVEESANVCLEKANKESIKKSCMKCGEPPVVIIRAVDPMCKDCFVAYCTHKFRSGFGKSKLVRDGELVVVGLSGGPSSAAMLHLIQEGKSLRAKKKLRFVPVVVYVDEGVATGMNGDERNKRCEDMSQLLSICGFKYHIVQLEQVMNEQAEDAAADSLIQSLSSVNLDESARQTSQLQELLASCKTLTAKEALIHTLRQRLLVRVARELGCKKVLLGDCTTRLAVHMISNITQGRGAHVASDMAFSDSRHGDILLIRPMRELNSKEVAMYNKLNKLQTFTFPGLDTKMPSHASLDRLTEDFVVGLQTNFPNTTTTILRTGEKLQPSEGGLRSETCSLCKSRLDTIVKDDECSALAAILFSHSLSVGGPSQSVTHAADHDAPTQTSRLPSSDVISTVCYGCHLVLKDMADISKLPGRESMTGITHSLTRSEMKKRIGDCLLPSDET